MKISTFSISLFFYFLTSSVFAQSDMTLYKLKVKEGDSLYKVGKYQKSADAYAIAFHSIGRKAYPNDRYNAACSYALAGEKDSALFHLYRLADGASKYKNLDHLTADQDLISLHKEEQWKEIVNYVKANKEEAEKYLEKPLAEMLDSIYKLDQNLRLKSRDMTKELGWGSAEVKELWKKIQYQDSINEIAVTQLLDERGWLGPEVIGNRGSSALFLVIQHAPLETQQKYLPMMRQAVKEGKAQGSSLALLEDRILLRTGKKQIYGSQIGSLPDGSHYVRALSDPLNVDARRKEVGLRPLNEYTQIWNFSFDPNEYLKKLPEYEKMLEEMNNSKK